MQAGDGVPLVIGHHHIDESEPHFGFNGARDCRSQGTQFCEWSDKYREEERNKT